MKRTVLITLAAVLSAGTASAHHGWGSYDVSKAFTISAPVETLSWADPHARIMLKYEGARGDELGWMHHGPTFSAACWNPLVTAVLRVSDTIDGYYHA